MQMIVSYGGTLLLGVLALKHKWVLGKHELVKIDIIIQCH